MAASRSNAKVPSTDEDLEDMPFIAFEQPGSSKGSAHQKIIRKHLGRRRRKQAPTSKQTKYIDPKEGILSLLCTCAPDIPEFLHAAVDDGRSMVLESCDSCGKHRFVEASPALLSPSSSLGQIEFGSCDPFDALALPTQPYTHDLIQHFMRVTAPSTIPIPQIAHLFPNIAAAMSLMVHDEVLLQSAMSISSMHQDYLRGLHNPSTTSLEEHGKAIALVNTGLSDTSNRPSDGLMIAISILCACQMIAGNFESWQAHLLGLRQLLQLRGGLDADDLIRDNIFECDAVGAALFDVPPLFAGYVKTRDRQIFEAATLPYELIIVNEDLRHTFVDIRELCQSFNLLSVDPNVDKPAISDFAEKRSAIEYQLLITTEQDVVEENDESGAATRCCRFAAQIFVYQVFRNISPGSIIHERLAGRLREAMMEFDEDQSSQHATTMLLWLSVLGYLALKPGPLRLWFAGWVLHCASELDICSIEDLTYQLRKIVWSDQVLRQRCEEMWAELQQMQSIGLDLKIVGENQV